jgi:hypothetical protein
MFPPEEIGRANGVLNVLHLGMAFVLRYGTGVVASFWNPDSFGRFPVIAYRAAFALPMVLEFLALVWFAMSSMSWERQGALSTSNRQVVRERNLAVRAPDFNR